LHGFPADADFRFFVGQALTQVCIGMHEMILRFSDDVTVTVEGDLGVGVAVGAERIFSDYRKAAADVASFLSRAVADVEPQADGTLSLKFGGGGRLNFYDSSSHYESYQIQYQAKFYIV
jgi:hypothetical protein